VELTIDCPEDLIIESKPGPINQILINLILNSIIHGFENKPDGAITISVIYLSDQLHFVYKDDGIGIKDSIKTKIFEPFTTTKRGSGGSGLGLHLVFNLVTQALNGHIDFESSEGLGTTFNMTFPVLPYQSNSDSPEAKQ
jgi:signal transduction histidine kinase